MSSNIDADVIEANWLRVVARIRVLRALRPDLTDALLRVVAEAEQLNGRVYPGGSRGTIWPKEAEHAVLVPTGPWVGKRSRNSRIQGS